MKIELDRDEVQAIIAKHVADTFGGEWACETSDFDFPRRVQYAQHTPEAIARKAKEDADQAAWMAEYKRKPATEQSAVPVEQAA